MLDLSTSIDVEFVERERFTKTDGRTDIVVLL